MIFRQNMPMLKETKETYRFILITEDYQIFINTCFGPFCCLFKNFLSLLHYQNMDMSKSSTSFSYQITRISIISLEMRRHSLAEVAESLTKLIAHERVHSNFIFDANKEKHLSKVKF